MNTPGIFESPTELAAEAKYGSADDSLLCVESAKKTGTSASIASKIVLQEPLGELSK